MLGCDGSSAPHLERGAAGHRPAPAAYHRAAGAGRRARCGGRRAGGEGRGLGGATAADFAELLAAALDRSARGGAAPEATALGASAGGAAGPRRAVPAIAPGGTGRRRRADPPVAVLEVWGPRARDGPDAPAPTRSPRRRRCGPSWPSTSCTLWPVGAVGTGRPPRGRPAKWRQAQAYEEDVVATSIATLDGGRTNVDDSTLKELRMAIRGDG